MTTPLTGERQSGGIPVRVRLWPADDDRLAYLVQYLQDTGVVAGPVTISTAVRHAILIACVDAKGYYDGKARINDGD